jgi:hypothetical protein
VQVGVREQTAPHSLTRCNAAGPAGLDDARRAGRPTYSEAVRSPVIAKARGRPPQPAGAAVAPTWHWTLDRLQAELNREGLPRKRG